jgi:hypothetical protein
VDLRPAWPDAVLPLVLVNFFLISGALDSQYGAGGDKPRGRQKDLRAQDGLHGRMIWKLRSEAVLHPRAIP